MSSNLYIQEFIMHQDKITVLYRYELLGSLFFYFLVQFSSLGIGPSMHAGTERTLVLFSPLLPFLLMMGVVVRYFQRVDEYLRLKIMENWALTAAITGVLTFTYSLFESLGFPRLSMCTVMPMMGTVSAVLFILRRLATFTHRS
jgi:hypothetical protein